MTGLPTWVLSPTALSQPLSAHHYSVSCQHQSTKLMNALIIFTSQGRTLNPTSLPPSLSANSACRMYPFRPLRGTVWPSHAPNHIL